MNSMEQRINNATTSQALEDVVGFYQDILDKHRERFQEPETMALLFERDLQTAIGHYDLLATEPAKLEELKEAAQVVQIRYKIWSSQCL